MTSTVRILPSGHEFIVEGGDTVLEAGLKAGLALNYGCSNGNCGSCRARLVEGGIDTTRPYDFSLTEAEKAQDYFLMCSHAPTGAIVIEADVAAGAADMPHQEIVGRLRKPELLSDQVMQLHIQTPRSQRLRFLAGQSVRLGGGQAPERVLPLASCPCDGRNLYFHVPHIPGDDFCEWVFDGGARDADRLSVAGPEGDFVLALSRQRPVVLIAWHTGFAPLKSLISHAVALEHPGPVWLYRLSPVPGEHYLGNWCRACSDALDELIYRPLDRRFTLMSNACLAEEIMAEIAGELDDLANSDVFVAGPAGLVTGAQKVFADRGVGKDRLNCHTIRLSFDAG